MEAFGGNSDAVSSRELAGLNPNEQHHEADQQEEAGGAVQRTHIATPRHHHVETPRADGSQGIIGYILSSKVVDHEQEHEARHR